MSAGRTDTPFGVRERETMARTQDAALSPGRAVVSCSAPLGVGGLGRHVSEIVDALQRAKRATVCISGTSRASDQAPPPRHALGLPYLTRALAASLAPVPVALRARALMVEFDAYAAQQLPPSDQLIAFNSQALAQFRAARRLDYQSIALVSANSHIRRVARQHALARSQYPLEGSWATHLVRRNLAEYAAADRIYVASRYIRESFLEQGIADELLSDFRLTPHPRYTRESTHPTSDCFDIVYVGSLAVHKGVPLLIDAFRRLSATDMRLVLVGGWGTRGMRRFVQSACASDSRISVCPGDPLPHLRSARLCVHPAYEDGFAYAPAEALACGVPVIVSEDTGMKDLIDPARTGLVLPTGDLGALTEAIEAAYRGEAVGTSGSVPRPPGPE